MRTVDRKPNWGVWGNVPHVQAWEAIALSLDIDPKKMRGSQHGWMADNGQFPHTEGDVFDDRLEVLRRNLTKFQLHSIQMGRPDYCGIFVVEFARWALAIGWEIPEQLTALAQRQTPQPAGPESAVHDKALATRERRSLLAIIAALARIGDVDIKRPSKAAETIAAELAQMGITMSPRTIENHLNAVPEALDRKQTS